VSPWWVLALVLIPVALGAGHWVGGIPVSAKAPESSPPRAEEAGPAEIRWRPLADAMDESRRTGKPILLDFNAEWCGPCQAMKREVFESRQHAGAIESAVIPVTLVDQVRERGANPAELEDLQRRYAVDAFPTLVVFSAATGRAEQHVGYGGADGTEGWIRQAAQTVGR
jgi:thiol:disulfide interchange protein